MKKIHTIAAAMFMLIGIFSSQSMSASATNLKCKGCVGSSDIAKNAVTSSRIKSNSVSTSKIKNGAVTHDKLAPDVADDLGELRIGKRSTIRTFIDIDCDANANVLLEPPYNENYFPNTTLFITGACNGPIQVYSDGVRLVGVEANRAASIVLPNPTADPSWGAVFAEGAHDLRIENLTIDASAWDTWAVAEESEAAGVYARNAFVRLIDVDVKGGLYGVNPFRNAIIQMEGEINITDFIKSGISSGDQSTVRANGQVNVSTTRTDSDYLNGIDAYRSGVVDLRGGLVVTVPAVLDNAKVPSAIKSGGHGLVQVRVDDSGTVNITGDVSTYRVGLVEIRSGTIAGDINISGASALHLSDTTQTTGDIDISDGSTIYLRDTTQTTGEISAHSRSLLVLHNHTHTIGEIFVHSNSTARIYDSTVGFVNVFAGSFLEINEGQVNGVKLGHGSTGSIYGASITADVSVDGESSNIHLTIGDGAGTLNGNDVNLCGNTSSYIEPAMVATANAVNDFSCSP